MCSMYQIDHLYAIHHSCDGRSSSEIMTGLEYDVMKYQDNYESWNAIKIWNDCVVDSAEYLQKC